MHRSIQSRERVIVTTFAELKEALQVDETRKIELANNIMLTDSITIRGSKWIDGRGYQLERMREKNKVYGGTLFLMVGRRCEWSNITIYGGGTEKNVTGKVFGRLLEARRGVSIIGEKSVWKGNVNAYLAVDGGGAIWIRNGAKCVIDGGEILHNQNVSCGAGIRIDQGASCSIKKGKINDNTVKGAGSVKGFEGIGAAIYNEGNVYIKSGEFLRNKAFSYTEYAGKYGGVGGAIYNLGKCVIESVKIYNNYATQRGSAIYNDKKASLKLTKSKISLNKDSEKKPIYLAKNGILQEETGDSVTRPKVKRKKHRIEKEKNEKTTREKPVISRKTIGVTKKAKKKSVSNKTPKEVPTMKPKEMEVTYVSFCPVTTNETVMEEWFFDKKSIEEIKHFMDNCQDPFSQETNQKFMQRFIQYRRGGSLVTYE